MEIIFQFQSVKTLIYNKTKMGESESENEAPKVKLRPIVRLGMFLISHSHLLRYPRTYFSLFLHSFIHSFIALILILVWCFFCFFSVVCCTAGVLTLLLLPLLAKNTYISENALMPGLTFSLLVFFLIVTLSSFDYTQFENEYYGIFRLKYLIS